MPAGCALVLALSPSARTSNHSADSAVVVRVVVVDDKSA